MGQKVNPKGFRVGVIRDWDAVGMPKKGSRIIFWKTIKSANILKRNSMPPASPASNWSGLPIG